MSTRKRRSGRTHRTPRRNHPLLSCNPSFSWYLLFFALLCLLLPLPVHSQVVVGFSGVDAESDPDRLLFRCQLMGYEEEEVPCASPVRYPALPPGTYTFRVRALDEDRMASESATATITLISAAPPTPTLAPTPVPAPTPTPQVIERVVFGLPREAVIPLIGGLGALAILAAFGAVIWQQERAPLAPRLEAALSKPGGPRHKLEATLPLLPGALAYKVEWGTEVMEMIRLRRGE